VVIRRWFAAEQQVMTVDESMLARAGDEHEGAHPHWRPTSTHPMGHAGSRCAAVRAALRDHALHYVFRARLNVEVIGVGTLARLVDPHGAPTGDRLPAQ
jgi:hypothetical protein